MLATPWEHPFSDPEWIFEEKVDGFRTLLYWDGREVELRSRSGRDVTRQYPELSAFSAQRSCVLDGEIVVRDAGGHPRFESMQQRTGVPGPLGSDEMLAEFPIDFIVFDLLYDGEELIHLPLEERRQRLDTFELPHRVEVSAVVAEDGLGLWSTVLEQGLEGMVAKRLGRPYLPGRRAEHWRKISHVRSMRGVVGGFTPGEGGRDRSFGALLVGLWTEAGLRWVGSVGTGFDDAALAAIREALDQMIRPDSPFTVGPELPREATWVEPQLVARVGYKEWTKVGRLRAPRFQGFTDDDPESVTWESEGPGEAG
jgi:bifunctional non-homologous end joining protein LigD